MNRTLLLCALFIGAGITSYAYEIHPEPQETIDGNGTVTLSQEINLVVEEGISPVSVARIKEVLERNNISFTVSNSRVDDKTNILIGNKSGGIVADYAAENGIDLKVFEPADNKFDEHLLQINGNSNSGDIVIIGNGDKSEFYAMATLEQILQQSNGSELETVTINDYAYTQYRGIVEGFYGFPFTVEARLELLEFCKRYKLNTFIYGPKSDPYHLGWWKDDYPQTITDEQRYKGFITQEDLKTISAKATACNVDFVWAAHPGMQNGIDFYSSNGIENGVQDIMRKFDHLYSLGLRAFGVFIDDMTNTPPGDKQAKLATLTQQALRNKYGNEVAPLFFVPTTYALNYDRGGAYLRYMKDIDKDVAIAFTGYDCFSNIRGAASNTMKDYCGRNAVMWWNNPVNDDHDNWIYMRKMTTHWTIEDQSPISSLGGLVMNPMNQGQASKVALFGGAEYGWNPAKFDADKSWQAFFKTEFEDTEISEALQTFARHSDARVEEEALIAMYETFKNEYQDGQLPAIADDLQQEMSKLYDACVTIEKMKNSETKKYSLMYQDLRPWVNKLKAMSGIVKDAISIMKNNTADSWALISSVKQKAATLKTDKAYAVAALEDAGTNTREVFYQAEASKEHLEPFAEYIAALVDGYEVAGLPERETEPAVITNIDNLPETVSLTDEAGLTTLEGLQDILLQAKQYIGINLQSIKDATVKADANLLPEGVEIQTSVSGKEWTAFEGLEERETLELVYVRIKNTTNAEAAISINSVSVYSETATEVPTPTATTNMKAYQTYGIENVIDGNKETFFWKDGEQAVGDNIILDYGTVEKRGNIVISFTDNDRPTGEVTLSLSKDGEQWETISTFTQSNIDSNGDYTTTAAGKTARFIKLEITSINGIPWLQIAEISVEGNKAITQATSGNGEPLAMLSDRKLTQSYTPDGEGHVLYRFIENIKIDTIYVYNMTDFSGNAKAPIVELEADKQWKKLGQLESYTTIFDVVGTDSISALKISWDADNIPGLVEIYPIGKPYVEREKVEDEGTSLTGPSANRVAVSRNGSEITVAADRRIAEITVWDTDGKVIMSVRPEATKATVTLGTEQKIVIASITLEDGRMIVRKL